MDERGGRVVLVGGGPGDPDLITVRGHDALLRADVIVADRLGPASLLREIGVRGEVIDVGKRPYHHPVPQERINELLIERARRGEYVVRLKGGDPFVFGRGGEEVLACERAGVRVEVVPGVSSAIAAPAAARVPVTHRGVATGMLVISGHDELSYDVLARWPHTIVVLMGMARLPEIAAGLIAHGMPASRPAAVVQQAHTDRQGTVRGELGTIAGASLRAGLGNPAVIVIGEVVDVLGEPASTPPLRALAALG
ncbi:uroporphyrinogen-III C-methyltransferase [Epidermidibacterium keratini]|uniref:uroporphyrinogen-III C-methyltransferase n=1 Tax=Epidermidibacterium keratini TaxID=1891644 RepID=A0A7L4YPY1_9ACTN|nr:uroporphyrinogen-III C-methyltransferase [Epidermidibacterium keratini]QHC01335.1 uroporphyrinogen-III C-methyltransferase [Epidermidibacterium keratini]